MQARNKIETEHPQYYLVILLHYSSRLAGDVIFVDNSQDYLLITNEDENKMNDLVSGRISSGVKGLHNHLFITQLQIMTLAKLARYSSLQNPLFLSN